MRIFNLGAWNLAGICINTFHNYLLIFVKFDDVIKKLWTKNSEFSMDYVTKHYVIVVQYLLLKLTSQWPHWICLFIDTKYNIGCHRKFRVNPVFVETILISLLHNREIEKATSAQITIERRGGKRIFFFVGAIIPACLIIANLTEQCVRRIVWKVKFSKLHCSTQTVFV